MQELSERMYGFDTAQLGFPSIAACRAIVLQTTAGLFGFHNASSHTSAAIRAAEFASYVHGHVQWIAGSGRVLYVICYTESPVTGYGSNSLSEWKAEAQIFANALGFNGRRMGYSLSPSHGALSSYVRVDQSVSMPTIKVGPWDHNATYIVTGSINRGADISWLGSQNTQIGRATAVNMPSPPLKQVHPQALD